MLDIVKTREFNQLEQIIRSGISSDCPTLIYSYIQLGAIHAHRNNHSTERETYVHIYHTLLETICDPLIDRHWRKACLDNINKPLTKMYELAQTCCEQRITIELNRELLVISKYFI